jgi:hypothetical protein
MQPVLINSVFVGLWQLNRPLAALCVHGILPRRLDAVSKQPVVGAVEDLASRLNLGKHSVLSQD